MIDLVIAGGGAHLIEEAAAACEMRRSFPIRRVAGTSAGAACAAMIATGIPDHVALEAITDIFASGDVLDGPSWWFDRFGLHPGDRIHAALRSLLPGTLGDALIPLAVVTSSLSTSKPLVLSSWEHPRVPMALAVRASMGIPGVFKCVRLGGLDAASPDFVHTLVDGGAAMNFAMSLFDDDAIAPTVGIRTRGLSPPPPCDVSSTAEYVLSLGRLMMWAADHAHVSRKHWARIVDVLTAADAFDFRVPRAAVSTRWAAATAQTVSDIARLPSEVR